MHQDTMYFCICLQIILNPTEYCILFEHNLLRQYQMTYHPLPGLTLVSLFSSNYLCLLRRFLYLLSLLLYKTLFKTCNLKQIDHIQHTSSLENSLSKMWTLHFHTFIFLSLDLLSWHQAKQVIVSCLSNDSSTSLAVKNISIFTKSFKK